MTSICGDGNKLNIPEVTTILAQDENLEKNWKSLLNVLFKGDFKDSGLKQQLSKEEDVKERFRRILQEWQNKMPEEATPAKLIEILRSDAFESNGTADKLRAINGFSVSENRFSNIIFNDCTEFDSNKFKKGRLGKLTEILQRWNVSEKDFNKRKLYHIETVVAGEKTSKNEDYGRSKKSTVTVRDNTYKKLNETNPATKVEFPVTYGQLYKYSQVIKSWLKWKAAIVMDEENTANEAEVLIGDEISYKVFQLIKSWRHENTNRPVTLDTVTAKLAEAESLRCVKLEWEMYIEELKDRSKMSEVEKSESGVVWSGLFNYKNLRLLCNSGTALLFEGHRFPEQGKYQKAKPKLHLFAIKVFPLSKHVHKNVHLMKRLKTYCNLEHDNVLTTTRIWTEKVTKQNEKEYEARLGLKSHHDKLHPTEEHPIIEILCLEMEYCKIDLRVFLQFNITPTLNDRMEIFLQILEAVIYIHKYMGNEGHGNLCPETILLLNETTKRGPQIRIANKSKTKTSKFAQLYIAAEYEDEDDAEQQDDHRPNDMFALGMILFELFCPSAQSNLMITGRKLQRGDYPENFSNEWPQIKLLVRKLLCPDSAKRMNAIDFQNFLNQELLDSGAKCIECGNLNRKLRSNRSNDVQASNEDSNFSTVEKSTGAFQISKRKLNRDIPEKNKAELDLCHFKSR